ncbi:MAG TPA: NAD-dependent epimerase/dehydratase family protein, partial [Inquilinus sp.]
EGKSIRIFKSHKEGFADGEQSRDFVYVKDCTAVILWLLTNPTVCGLFNLGTGKARSFKDLMLAVGGALGQPVAFDYVDMPVEIRAQYQYFTQAEMTKLRRAGYQAPFHSLENGVRDYVQRYLTTTDRYR